MRTKWVHRSLAVFLGVFIISHLGVQLTALGGANVHLASLDAIQWVYRNPVGESLLVIALLVQIVTGLRRVRLNRAEGWARAQVISGAYLAFFLILHTSAALYTHHIYGLETDFYWAAGSLAYSPLRYGFALYYLAAVIAVFVHLAAALHYGWKGAPRLAIWALPITGSILAVLMVASFAGLLYPIDIGDDVAGYYAPSLRLIGAPP